MKKLPLLGNISPDIFFREYWQKKPLLIRQAIPGFKPLISRDELFEIATNGDVESRLIACDKKNWGMKSGPFLQLPSIQKKQWTLLLQGMNLHNADIDDLLRRFRFIPDTRLDDLMISYASDGGGVGPHFDSYDVFLLQADGRRHWRIGAQKDLALDESLPLKILKNFQPQQEYVLEPGDMLYLPPQYAHEGVAIGECMTYSIGFRAPSYQELGEAFLQFMADSIDLPGHYSDPDIEPSKHPAEIDARMLKRIATELDKIRFTEDDIAIFLGERMSEPKNNVFFEQPEKPLTPMRFQQAAAKRGLALSRKSQMLYRGKHIFINGESFAVDRNDKATLAVLADDRKLDGAGFAAASEDVIEALYTWYQDGWLHIR